MAIKSIQLRMLYKYRKSMENNLYACFFFGKSDNDRGWVGGDGIIEGMSTTSLKCAFFGGNFNNDQ